MNAFFVVQCLPAAIGMMVHCFHAVVVEPVIEAFVVRMLKVRTPSLTIWKKEAFQVSPWQVPLSNVLVPAQCVILIWRMLEHDRWLERLEKASLTIRVVRYPRDTGMLASGDGKGDARRSIKRINKHHMGGVGNDSDDGDDDAAAADVDHTPRNHTHTHTFWLVGTTR